jgi:hypothetical protein
VALSRLKLNLTIISWRDLFHAGFLSPNYFEGMKNEIYRLYFSAKSAAVVSRNCLITAAVR